MMIKDDSPNQVFKVSLDILGALAEGLFGADAQLNVPANIREQSTKTATVRDLTVIWHTSSCNDN
jgi:hypothetical protein